MKSGRLWPWAITGVLAFTVAANLVVLKLATEPESATVEPDYYRKAVAWDSTSAQLAHDVHLGWRVTPRLGAWPAGGGATPLSVTLADAAGHPLDGATIGVTAIHNALASHPLAFVLAPTGEPGAYAAAPTLLRRGEWELRFVVRRAGETFTADTRVDALPGSGEAR